MQSNFVRIAVPEAGTWARRQWGAIVPDAPAFDHATETVAPVAPVRRPVQLPFNPETLHLRPSFAEHPILEPLTQRWLKAVHPGPWSSRAFKERLAHASAAPASLETLLVQVTHVLDIEPMPIRVGPMENLYYAEVGQSSEGLVLVCHPGMLVRPRNEQRFFLLKALYSHFQRFNGVASLAQNWNPESREHVLSLFFVWNQRNSRPILNEDWGSRETYPKGLARLSQWLNQLYQKYRSPALGNLRELLVRGQPFRRELELEANLFATLACGLEVANTAVTLAYNEEFAKTQNLKLAERVDQILAQR